MTHKFFPLDRNYILREAQLALEDKLLHWLVEEVKAYYMVHYNPLGLEDDSILRIKRTTEYNFTYFNKFYKILAGLYRYHNHGNQLELLFDGRTHFEKFSEEWTEAFQEQVFRFCAHPNFIKYVLEAAIFFQRDKKLQLVEQRMRVFLTDHFDVKVYKYRGMPEFKIA